jgi:SAM-dependent methyltransferase
VIPADLLDTLAEVHGRTIMQDHATPRLRATDSRGSDDGPERAGVSIFRWVLCPLMSAVRRCIVCDRAGPFTFVFAFTGYPWTMVRCPGCGLVFQDPQPEDEVLAGGYYQDPEFSRSLLGALREFTLHRAREKLLLLRGVGAARPGQRALDVGCSSGAWLEVAAAEGIVATGVELGETTAQDARNRGLDVRTGTLEQAFPAQTEERFDLITFWDVLEHLRDPRQELAAAARLLTPGGVVAATFPNVEGWYPRLTYRLLARRTGAWEYPELPLHLYDFAPGTARRLFERTGYEVFALKTSATPFQFYRETSLSLPRLGGRGRALALRFCFEALKFAVYPAARLCDRGNAMFVAASRPRPSA